MAFDQEKEADVFYTTCPPRGKNGIHPNTTYDQIDRQLGYYADGEWSQTHFAKQHQLLVWLGICRLRNPKAERAKRCRASSAYTTVQK